MGNGPHRRGHEEMCLGPTADCSAEITYAIFRTFEEEQIWLVKQKA